MSMWGAFHMPGTGVVRSAGAKGYNGYGGIGFATGLFFVNVGATVRVWGLCGEYTVQDQTRVRSVELCIITNIIIIIIIIVKHPTWRE